DNIDTFRTNIKSAVEKPLKKLAKKYSLFRSYNISNPKIDFGFSISNLKKALFVQSENKETFENYAKMLSVLDKIIENAVLIEVHDDMYKGTPREDKQLDGVYVFLSGFEINDEIIPIELLVKSFVDKENTLYVTATLGSIKKEENSVIAVAPKKERGSTARLFSTYSVPQIIKNIKPQFGEFIKYIPDGLLTDEQIDAKIAALLKQQKKIEQLKKGVRGGTEYSRVLNQNALEYVDRLKSGSRQQWEKIDILTGLAENAQGPEISDAALRKIARKYDFSEKNRAEIRQMAERLKTASGMLDTAANIDTVLYGLYMIARNEYENAGHYEDFDDVSARFREEFRTNGKMISVYMPTDIYNTVAEYYGGRAAFRRAMFGKMNVTDNTSKGGIGLDEFYDSLVKGNYGLEETTDPSTQINNMLALYNSDTKYWVDDSYAFTMQGESLEERATDTAFNMLVDLLTAGKKDKQTKAAIERINALQEEIKTARAEGIQSIITMADAELQRKLDELSKSGKDTVAIEIERERLKNENRIKW
ncbi:MAG: hypothetical protein J1E34_10435, partial [Oscillospiraceae bacterium]|nr:hypothetical protein [Oscillospiraceae bacterium]